IISNGPGPRAGSRGRPPRPFIVRLICNSPVFKGEGAGRRFRQKHESLQVGDWWGSGPGVYPFTRVIPAHAGIPVRLPERETEIPACAGITSWNGTGIVEKAVAWYAAAP